jgi:hypothetical protein
MSMMDSHGLGAGVNSSNKESSHAPWFNKESKREWFHHFDRLFAVKTFSRHHPPREIVLSFDRRRVNGGFG